MSSQVTDQHYIYELAEFEWETAKRLKRDKGYMGKMSFPENLDKPARTVMATMTASAREAMILEYGNNRYRLPTVREAACMMSFPIDYWFYGKSKGVKHTLVGNAVPPKLSYAVALAIAKAEAKEIPSTYIPIKHPNYNTLPFVNLNGIQFTKKKERPKRKTSKFKYHIPYLIIDAYRVELTNYQSDFKNEKFKWKVEVCYSQGKDKARVFTPDITMWAIPSKYKNRVREFINQINKVLPDMNTFQTVFCLTTEERSKQRYYGPYELLVNTRKFIEDTFPKEDQERYVHFGGEPTTLPLAIAAGYLVLRRAVTHMGRLQQWILPREKQN